MSSSFDGRDALAWATTLSVYHFTVDEAELYDFAYDSFLEHSLSSNLARAEFRADDVLLWGSLLEDGSLEYVEASEQFLLTPGVSYELVVGTEVMGRGMAYANAGASLTPVPEPGLALAGLSALSLTLSRIRRSR